ncbi:MAG: transcriptional regulator [Candidatus Riflebacteria bacterium]|nr:transcriptional regulator [Candidatus Riflebacteria bacterium]
MSERTRTVRQSILAELRRGPVTALDLSKSVGVQEKEVASHLEHLQQSLRRGPSRLVVEPAECIACGFVFEHRKRLKKPSSCPECRASRIHPPRYRIDAEPTRS